MSSTKGERKIQKCRSVKPPNHTPTHQPEATVHTFDVVVYCRFAILPPRRPRPRRHTHTSCGPISRAPSQQFLTFCRGLRSSPRRRLHFDKITCLPTGRPLKVVPLFCDYTLTNATTWLLPASRIRASLS